MKFYRICGVVFVLMFFVNVAYAGTVGGSAPYGGEVLSQEASHLKEFLFGPALKVAGIFGFGYGLVRAFAVQNIQPVLVFGGIGLSTIVGPKFIDAVFTALIP